MVHADTCSGVRYRVCVAAAVLCWSLILVSGASAAAGWSRQTTPNPGDTGLNGVSCVPVSLHLTDCMAAGVKVDSVGNNDPFAMYWNGSTWSPMAPTVSVGPQSAFLAVSCAAARYCLAVGLLSDGGINDPVAEVWNGASWTPETVPLPPDVRGGTLSGVSCTSPSACTAVGTIDHYSGAHTPLVVRWNGTRFTPQTLNVPGGAVDGYLEAVSCPAAGSCTAVGEDGPSSGTLQLMTARWDGSVWTAHTLPLVSGANPQFHGVSCPTTTMCAAVGEARTSGGQGSLVSVWNGSSWGTSYTVAIAGTTSAALSGVSCTGPTACTAVGKDTAATSHVVALRYTGAQWVLEPIAPPSTTDNELDGVSCTTAIACTAVGSDLDSASHHLTLAEVWGGPAWTSIKTPAVSAPKLADLFSSSCPNANWCVAVGQWESSVGRLVALGEGWDGSAWRLLPPISLPSGAQGATLLSVSCPLVRECVAVGSYQRTVDNHLLPLIESWNGSTWRLISTPDPHAALAQLDGVSCTSISLCIAVGFREATLGGVTLPVAAKVAGSSASLQTLPVPQQTDAAALHSVWCDTRLHCNAVGNWDQGHGEQPFDESFDSAVWRADLPPPAPSSTQAELLGVSCTISLCLGVGSFDSRTGQTVPLAEQQVGGPGWGLVSPSPPAGSSGAGLYGVSCSGFEIMCMAVGYSVSSSHLRTLADLWNGSRWQASSTPVSATTDMRLFGVSCPASTNCVAVGVLGSNEPLAEIYS